MLRITAARAEGSTKIQCHTKSGDNISKGEDECEVLRRS